MNQETKSLLAVGLSVLVFILYYNFFGPKQQPKPEQPVAAQSEQVAQPSPAEKQATTPATTTAVAQTPATADPQAGVPVQETVIESDLYKVTLTNDGGVPTSWQMKKFGKSGKEEGLIELVNGEGPLADEFIMPGIPSKPRYTIVDATPDRVIYLWKGKDFQVLKTYQFNLQKYILDMSVEVKNLTRSATEGAIATRWSTNVKASKNGGFMSFLKGPENIFQPVYMIGTKVEREPTTGKEGAVMWGGVEDRYFMSAIIPRGFGPDSKVVSVKDPSSEGSSVISTKITSPKSILIPDKPAEYKFSVYVGPKEMANLKEAGAMLEKAIDYGWFSFVAVPILYLLKFFYGIVKNYGLAIIVLTIFVKLLLHPLTKHSMKSMKAMQQLQPKMKELREKFKNDKERLNMETMQLFKTHKVNPMGGCLPMLLQLPIYIALYKVLWNSIELYKAPFFGFYNDLSAPDPYFIMPVLLGVAMWLQQKLTPSATADPAQAKMMQIMPIMFTAFMLFLPSGLVLYIFVNTIMGVVQQWMTNNDLRLRDVLTGKFKATAKA